jgi:hypothetical protein
MTQVNQKFNRQTEGEKSGLVPANIEIREFYESKKTETWNPA